MRKTQTPGRLFTMLAGMRRRERKSDKKFVPLLGMENWK